MSTDERMLARSVDHAGEREGHDRPDGDSEGIAGALLALLEELFGPCPPIAFELWDGRRLGPWPSEATIRFESVDGLVRAIRRPGQLGLARAYVSGDITVDGDIFAALEMPEKAGPVSPKLSQLFRLAWACRRHLLRRLPVPPEEARLRGLRHSPLRDRDAIAHHYDVSNDFYRLVLGPTMTYSCAVWTSPGCGVDTAQLQKHELVCHKLGLRPGDRLLDVGCGWGTLGLYAAERSGAAVVGITLSAEQHRWASSAAARMGRQGDPQDGPEPGRALFCLQDYRELDDLTFDAISSVGMSEHVGRKNLPGYFQQLYRHLRPGGRLLNHAISALPPVVAGPSGRWPRLVPLPRRGPVPAGRNRFVDRYVFPDGELVEVGAVVSAMQEAGFEVRHVESLREHYGLTLRSWIANLEGHWDEAVDLVGVRRARIWRLYMAASARTFETGRTGVHQVLAVKPDHGDSGLPLRPQFEEARSWS